MVLKEKFSAILAKLKVEWKTFVVAVVTTAGGAWQFAVAQGVALPDLLSWVKEEYKAGVIFIIGGLLLILRRYTPTDVIVEQPKEPEQPEEPK